MAVGEEKSSSWISADLLPVNSTVRWRWGNGRGVGEEYQCVSSRAGDRSKHRLPLRRRAVSLTPSVARETVEDYQDGEQVHVRAAPHQPAAEHLVVDCADAKGHRESHVMGVERALRHGQQHAERRALRGRDEQVQDLEPGVGPPTEPGRGLDDRPPEEERRREERRMLNGVYELVLDRGIIQKWQMPDPHGGHVKKPCHWQECERR